MPPKRRRSSSKSSPQAKKQNVAESVSPEELVTVDSIKSDTQEHEQKEQQQPPPPPPTFNPLESHQPPAPPKSSVLTKPNSIDLSLPYQNINVSIRLLVPSSLANSLEDPQNPITKKLITSEETQQNTSLSESSDETLEKQKLELLTKASHIEVSPYVAGVPERVVYLSGTCAGTSHAAAAICEYATLRNVLETEIVDSIAPSCLDSSNPESQNASFSLDQPTQDLLLSVFQALGLQLTLLVPEFVAKKKQLQNNVDNKTPKDTQKSDTREKEKEDFQLQISNSQLPLSFDHTLKISTSSTADLELALNQVIRKTLIPTLYRDQKEIEDKNKESASKNVDEEEEEDDDDANIFNSVQVEYSPKPIAGVYGHPDTFKRQHLNDLLVPFNPYITVSVESNTTQASDSVNAEGTNAVSSGVIPVNEPGADSTMDDANNYYQSNDTQYNPNATNNAAVGGNDAGAYNAYNSSNNSAPSLDGTVYLGNQEGLAQAQYQAQNAVPGQPFTQYVYIPKEVIGAVIGKQGSKINEIRKMSNTNMKLVNSNDSERGADHHGHDERNGGVNEHGDKKMAIIGTPETNQIALMLLYQRIEAERKYYGI